MKKTLTGATALALSATTALAGGLDRSGQSVMSVFAEDGAALSFGLVMPSVTGRDIGGTGSYDVGENYTQTMLSYTNRVNDTFSYSVIFDQPYGADVNYNDDPTTSNLGGTFADLNSAAVTFVGRYSFNDRFSVFAGLGAQRLNAQVGLHGLSYGGAIATAGVANAFNERIAGTPFPELEASELGEVAMRLRAATSPAEAAAAVAAINARYAGLPATSPLGVGGDLAGAVGTQSAALVTGGGYQFDMENTTKPSYLIGAAYEIPSIAFRLAGTYRFETTHKADTTETFGGGAPIAGDVEFVTPQSFNLEFQTGIAQNTLLTASYRWTEFSAVDLVPDTLGSDLVNLDDSHRYTLGVARRFNEEFAGSLSMSFEPKGNGATVSPLGPTDGLFGLSLGGQYTKDNVNISGGINYTWVGDADAGVADRAVASFEDNHVIGVGFKMEMKF